MGFSERKRRADEHAQKKLAYLGTTLECLFTHSEFQGNNGEKLNSYEKANKGENIGELRTREYNKQRSR
jgi:hypothetical protein